LFVATIYGLRETGAEITPLIAGGTVGGIILGLALQDSLSNFFAGIFLNMDRPARLGDLIRLENGEEGFLHEIGWRTTKIRTWSNNLLVIPNNKFAQMPLINLERPSSAATATIDFLVAHENDLNLVERLALEAALEAREICEDPEEEPPVVRFRTLTEVGVGVRVLVRSSTSAGQYRLAHETLRRLHAKLREHAIRFAQPR
jgi:small-conductance mechanosensitive channel